MQLASLELKAMLRNGMVAVAGAALVLGSFLVLTDASAAGRGGRGGGSHVGNQSARIGAQKSTTSRSTTSNKNNSSYGNNSGSGSNFGLTGPYIGTKFMGNL
jgi:hypothetical protein